MELLCSSSGGNHHPLCDETLCGFQLFYFCSLSTKGSVKRCAWLSKCIVHPHQEVKLKILLLYYLHFYYNNFGKRSTWWGLTILCWSKIIYWMLIFLIGRKWWGTHRQSTFQVIKMFKLFSIIRLFKLLSYWFSYLNKLHRLCVSYNLA